MISQDFNFKIDYEKFEKETCDTFEFIVSQKGWNYLTDTEEDKDEA